MRHLDEFKACPELPMDYYEHDLGDLMEITKRDRGLVGMLILSGQSDRDLVYLPGNCDG